jgi:uncharacterized protein YdhG (YjbR/CyaY superfamily)
MKSTQTRSGKQRARTVDEFLAALTDEQRSALMKLRRTIRAATPDAEECISYGIPAFRLGGKFFVGFGASARHCAFYPGALPVAELKRELKDYDTSKGTIRFQPDKPLPVSLVRRIVKMRLAEYRGRTRQPGTNRRRTEK